MTTSHATNELPVCHGRNRQQPRVAAISALAALIYREKAFTPALLVVITWPRRRPNVTSHLVGDFTGLQHVQPLRHGAVLDGAAVVHVVHDHRTQGLLPNQDLGRRQPVLQAAVLIDVNVVLKGPTVWGRAEAEFTGQTQNAAPKPDWPSPI